MNRKFVVFLAAAGVAALGAVALSARAKTPVNLAANNPGPAAVSLAKVVTVKSAPREEITGALNPARELKVGFEVAGRLARILVRKGAFVGEGQVIAQLDPELADAQVLQAEAAVKAAEAQSAMASDTAQRQTQLQQTGSVSEWQGKSSNSQGIAAAAQLQAARAQLAQARAARRRHDLRAPFSGVLIDAPDPVGATVAPGTALFKVGSRVHIEAVGGSAAADDAWVRAVIPSADPATRRIPVEVVVPNRDARFTAHTLARAILPMGSVEDAISIPASALSSQGGDHVYTLADGEIRRVAVQVIERGVYQILLKSSQPLDKVVDYPAPDLQDGAKVSVK